MHDELTLLPRLVVALAIGAAIGWERQRYHKPAGLRTHALIAMACALLMALSELVRRGVPNTTGDPVRMAQGILAGIGFIGAGTIVRNGPTVIGITTAGTIWVAATLGIVVGSGYYLLAIAGMVLSFVTIDGLGYLERRTGPPDPAVLLDHRGDELPRPAAPSD